MPLVLNTPVLPPDNIADAVRADPLWWFNRIILIGAAWYVWRALKSSR